MKVQCPNCGATIEVSGLGRKPLNIPVIFICDTLSRCSNVSLAATELGVSRGYIYKALTAAGLTPSDVIDGLAPKDKTLLHKGVVNERRQE